MPAAEPIFIIHTGYVLVIFWFPLSNSLYYSFCALCLYYVNHCLFFRLYENKGEADFMESLLQLFKSINEMMSSVSDQTVIVKVCVSKNKILALHFHLAAG